MSKKKAPINDEILKELSLVFYFPTSRYNTYSSPTSLIKSTFYQSKSSVCFPASKPISKIIPLDEKVS